MYYVIRCIRKVPKTTTESIDFCSNSNPPILRGKTVEIAVELCHGRLISEGTLNHSEFVQ